jgi:hypothetical protein
MIPINVLVITLIVSISLTLTLALPLLAGEGNREGVYKYHHNNDSWQFLIDFCL